MGSTPRGLFSSRRLLNLSGSKSVLLPIFTLRLPWPRAAPGGRAEVPSSAAAPAGVSSTAALTVL